MIALLVYRLLTVCVFLSPAHGSVAEYPCIEHFLLLRAAAWDYVGITLMRHCGQRSGFVHGFAGANGLCWPPLANFSVPAPIPGHQRIFCPPLANFSVPAPIPGHQRIFCPPLANFSVPAPIPGHQRIFCPPLANFSVPAPIPGHQRIFCPPLIKNRSPCPIPRAQIAILGQALPGTTVSVARSTASYQRMCRRF